MYLSIQTRITDARSKEYLAALKEARVDTLCIGFESPIDNELMAMNKGYLSHEMLKWTRLFKKQKLRNHGMFIFAYPSKDTELSHKSIKEKMSRYWEFIRKSKIDSLQLLYAIPLPGTILRQRLIDDGLLFSQEDVGWEYYDGQFPLYHQGDGVTPEEVQNAVEKTMKRFYRSIYVFRLLKNILLDFPIVVCSSVVTLFSSKIRYIKKAFRFWKQKFFKNNFLRVGGLMIVKKWFKQFRYSNFPTKLQKAERDIYLKNRTHNTLALR